MQRHEAALKTSQASSHDALNRGKTDENRSADIAESGSIRQRHQTGPPGEDLLLHLHRANKIFYCPLKSNHRVDGSGRRAPYRPVSDLQWSIQDDIAGKLIKVHGFPGALKVKLFRVVITTNRTEWVVTNDIGQSSTEDTREICGIRWKIEQYHREVKQTLGLEKCQCRSAAGQRNHIGCVVLAWNRMTAIARELKSNIYSVKKGMLSAYMRQELMQPFVQMSIV